MRKRTADEIRDISEKVYRHRLGDDDVKRMIEKDGNDGGVELRKRSGIYDPLVRDILMVIGMEEIEP